MSRLAPILGILLPLAVGACVDDWSQIANQPQAEASSGVADSEDSMLDAAFFAGYEADLESSMELFQVPGAAVAVVRGDRIIYQKGFGFRNLDRRQPVTESTLFRLGTLSRTLTTTMLGVLVDEDRLEWNQNLTGGVELARLLELGSRQPDKGPGFLTGQVSMEELMMELSGIPPTSDTGSGAHADPRRLFAATGYAAIMAGGDRRPPELGFRRLMHAKLFGPADMSRTAVGGELAAMGGEFASAYGTDLSGAVTEIDSPAFSIFCPYEGVASTVSDMARFLILQTREGIAQSRKRVISPSNLSISRGADSASARLPDGAESGEGCLAWQGEQPCHEALGWSVVSLGEGETLWTTHGGIAGYSASLSFLEQAQIGWVVLSNKDPELGGEGFNGQAADLFLARLLDLPWNPEARQRRHVQRLAELEMLAEEARPPMVAEVRPYLGSYAGGWRLSMDDRRLRLLRRMETFPVEAYNGDGFLIPEGPGMGTRVRFREHHDGSISMAFSAVDGAELASFGKVN